MTNANLTKFNNTFHTFLKELVDKYGRNKGVCDEYFHKYYNEFLDEPEKFETDDGFLLDYLELIQPQLNLLKDENLDIFKSRIIDHVFFNNEDLELDVTSIYDILRYYKVLFIYAFRYTYKGNVTELMHNSFNKSDDVVITDEEQIFLDIVESLKNTSKTRIEEQLNTEQKSTTGENDDFNISDIKKQMNSLMPGMGRMLDNELGQTAMNIMKDIDLNSIELGDPMKLIQSMMSGKVQEHSGINNLVSTITSKIHKHVEEGKIDTNSLQKQAAEMYKNNDEGLENMMKTMENNGEFMQDMVGKMMNFMGGKIDPEKMNEMMENMTDEERQEFMDNFGTFKQNMDSTDATTDSDDIIDITNDQNTDITDMQKQFTESLSSMIGGGQNDGEINPFSMLTKILGGGDLTTTSEHTSDNNKLDNTSQHTVNSVSTSDATDTESIQPDNKQQNKKALLSRLKRLRELKKAHRTRK